MTKVDRDLVRRRARNRCEYCHLPERLAPLAQFHVEHIIARQHGGTDDLINLCWSCHRCNLNKGPNLSGIEALTGRIVRLFNPRRDIWRRHFHWRGPVLVGKTSIGRASVNVLDINNPERVGLRRQLITLGLWSPSERAD